MPESWYEAVTEDGLEQGDILYGFPIVRAEIEGAHVRQILDGKLPQVASEIDIVDTIIMTQSCDLSNDKTSTVILCPIWNPDRLEDVGRNKLNSIRAGREHSWHLLNKDDDLDIPFTLVEFSRLFMANKTAVFEFASAIPNRPRLRPPYKEHLSQAFARYFMRVGLPSDIPRF